MTIIKSIQSGESAPRGYGFVRRDIRRDVTLVAPLGINILLQILHEIEYRVNIGLTGRSWRRKHDGEILAARDKGFAEGCAIVVQAEARAYERGKRDAFLAVQRSLATPCSDALDRPENLGNRRFLDLLSDAAPCCTTSHRPLDTACWGFERGANGRCVYCDHEEKCHPGPGATCWIGSGEYAPDDSRAI